MPVSLASGRGQSPLTPAKAAAGPAGGPANPGFYGPDLPVIRGKPESISRIPLDAMQDTRV